MLNEQQQAQILSLGREGVRLKDIGQRVGCSHVTVWKLLTKHHVQPRRQRQHSTDEAFPGSEYSDEERLFLRAVDGYRLATGKRFLTVCDHLRVLKGMGYRRGWARLHS